MKALYLAVLALCMCAVSCTSTRIWTCSIIQANNSVVCKTTYYDILWTKTTIVKSFTNFAADQYFYNPYALNGVDGTDNSRVICGSAITTSLTSNCRVFKIAGAAEEVRTYNSTSLCATATTSNYPTSICNCVMRPRLYNDVNKAGVAYYCYKQVRLYYYDGLCYTVLPLDPTQVVCEFTQLHEVEV